VIKKLAALAAVAATALLGVSAPAYAAPKLTGTLPEAAAENETVPLSFGLTGVEWEMALVTIEVIEGGLTVDLTGDTAASAGYDLSDATASTQSFYGEIADVVTTLEEGIDWYTPATAGEYTIDFTLEVQEYVSGLSYNPGNGHYYLVPVDDGGDPIELDADVVFDNVAAGDYTYAGLTGYLAEINDADENDFVAEFSGGDNIWIGGSAERTIINEFTDITADATNSGEWTWIHSQTQFADGLYTETGDPVVETFAVSVNDAFLSFNEGEPNGGHGEEGCLVTNVGGDPGLWNDLECSGTSNSFIIEFEPSDDVESATLTLTDEILAELADTGVDANGIALAAGALALAGAGALVYRRRRA
jgi:LPXTG-motif cell wall-anchored protein